MLDSGIANSFYDPGLILLAACVDASFEYRDDLRSNAELCGLVGCLNGCVK